MSHSVTDTGPSYSWMQLHWQSPVIGAALVLSYVAFSALLQYRYYYFKRHSPETWKVASYSNKSLQHSSSWWLPILSFWSTKERMPYHWFFATTNMCISGVFQCFLCEAILRGHSKIYWDFSDHSLLMNVLGFITPHIYQGVIEYYWHVALHWGPLYRAAHKIHHYYKNPEPYDDMVIHPLEGFGYYCILFSPPLVLPMHIYAWLAYMAINGLTGMLDHSGIRFQVPGLYDTADHDAHHSKFECNYAFPFPYLDILHGTYYGTLTLFGKEYQFIPAKWAKGKKLQ